MIIKFRKNICVVGRFNIDMFGQWEYQQEWEFDVGEEFEIKEILWSDPKKVKTRPGRPGGRMKFADLILKGENENSEYPDYLWFVPEDAFEIVKKK